MEIIVGEDFGLTDAIKEAIHDKVEQVKKHLKTETPVNVFLSKEGDGEFQVQLKVHDRHHDFSAKSNNSDFHVALNEAKSKLIRQVNDFKEKNLTKRHG